jgi:hypothetical protein
LSDILFVVSNARPGREKEYIDWYVDHHLPDVSAVPGVAGGNFYRATDPNSRWGYCARYTLNEPYGEIMSKVFARAGTPQMQLTDSIDSTTVVMLGATPQRKRITAEGAADAKTAELCVVLGDQSVGQDFKSWWDDRHVPTPIAQQGVFAAQPFQAKEIGGSKTSWANLATYDITSGKGRGALSALTGGSGGWRLPRSPNAKPEDFYIGLFELIA